MSDKLTPRLCPICNSITTATFHKERSGQPKSAPEWLKFIGLCLFWHPLTWAVVIFRLYDWPFRDWETYYTHRCNRCNQLLDATYQGSRVAPTILIHTVEERHRAKPFRIAHDAGFRSGVRKLGVSKVEGVSGRVPSTGESRGLLLLAIHEQIQRSGPIPLTLTLSPAARFSAHRFEIGVDWNGQSLGMLPVTWAITLEQAAIDLSDWSVWAHAVLGISPFQPNFGLRLTIYERADAKRSALPAKPATTPMQARSNRRWTPEEEDDLYEPPYDPDEEWY